MKNTLFTILILIVASGSLFAQNSKDLKVLAKWMAGSYNSTAQHEMDTANYFDIRLRLVPIWKDRTDGYWFYVEQAVHGFEAKPYRQRAYHLVEDGKGGFSSIVLTYNDPLRFAGKPELFEKTMRVDSLKEKEGCAVVLHRKDGKTFSGGTLNKNCPSDRQGATYTVSTVTITKKELRSWDQGFNAKDEQVWGATKGGYIFIKK